MFEMLERGIININVNGQMRTVITRPTDTLLHILREELGLTGAKAGCINGDCGTCTVIVDGWPIKSCLMLAVEAIGKEITTIEGLDNAPTQKAFLEKWGFQCGYCTSGFIMACHALAKIHPNADKNAINNWLQSNYCRCTGYEEIKEAITEILSSTQ